MGVEVRRPSDGELLPLLALLEGRGRSDFSIGDSLPLKEEDLLSTGDMVPGREGSLPVRDVLLLAREVRLCLREIGDSFSSSVSGGGKVTGNTSPRRPVVTRRT